LIYSKNERKKMDFQDCIKFAKENPICYLATTEGDQPRVRAMGLYSVDETGFYFNTQSVKAMAKQLDKNRKVELCFYCTKPGPDAGKVMRVSGEIEFLNDIDLRTRLLEDRPFLKEFIKGPEDPLLVVFRIFKGEAYFWTMADSMKEAELERIKFGG